jgi:hypothetical protein
MNDCMTTQDAELSSIPIILMPQLMARLENQTMKPAWSPSWLTPSEGPSRLALTRRKTLSLWWKVHKKMHNQGLMKATLLPQRTGGLSLQLSPAKRLAPKPRHEGQGTKHPPRMGVPHLRRVLRMSRSLRGQEPNHTLGVRLTLKTSNELTGEQLAPRQASNLRLHDIICHEPKQILSSGDRQNAVSAGVRAWPKT